MGGITVLIIADSSLIIFRLEISNLPLSYVFGVAKRTAFSSETLASTYNASLALKSCDSRYHRRPASMSLLHCRPISSLSDTVKFDHLKGKWNFALAPCGLCSSKSLSLVRFKRSCAESNVFTLHGLGTLRVRELTYFSQPSNWIYNKALRV